MCTGPEFVSQDTTSSVYAFICFYLMKHYHMLEKICFIYLYGCSSILHYSIELKGIYLTQSHYFNIFVFVQDITQCDTGIIIQWETFKRYVAADLPGKFPLTT